MKLQPRVHSAGRRSLWDMTDPGGSATDRFIADADTRVLLDDLSRETYLAEIEARFRGKSVLIALRSQLQTALVLLELDGIARRIVLATPDLMRPDIDSALAEAEIDVILSDGSDPAASIDHVQHVMFPRSRTARTEAGERNEPTEWVLFTSGTSGRPKLAVHGIESLTSLPDEKSPRADLVWSAFYDIRRYGGLQVLLRALKGGGSIVVATPGEDLAAHLERLGACGVTHVSGTPSHWRAVLLTAERTCLRPAYIRLGGEICDQAILDRLRECFPDARVTHAFASTEAGVVFDVQDGQAGFPVSFLQGDAGDVRMKVKGGSLHVRSARNATRYLGSDAPALTQADHFIDTGDLVEAHEGRYYFTGRRDGAINSGGFKINPETVEAVINRHPDIHSCQVYGRPSPVTGMLVVADLVLKFGGPLFGSRIEAVKSEVSTMCHASLSAHQVPVLLRLVPSLTVSAAGKLVRGNKPRGQPATG